MRNGNGIGGLIITFLVVFILISILFSPVTWFIVGAIVLYAVVRNLISRSNRQNVDADCEVYEDDQGYAYTARENVNPYSYRETPVIDDPFAEDDFSKNAVDVEVEVEETE